MGAFRVPPVNDCGVYLEEYWETLDSGLERPNLAYINIIQTGENEWRGSSNINIPNSGFGYAPSRSCPVFPTRQDAIDHCRKELERWCKVQLDRRDTTEHEKEVIHKVLLWLESFQQLRLF